MVRLKQQRHFKRIEIVILVSIVVTMVNTIFFKYLCIKLSLYKLSLFFMESNQLFKLAVVTVYVEIKNNCIHKYTGWFT